MPQPASRAQPSALRRQASSSRRLDAAAAQSPATGAAAAEAWSGVAAGLVELVATVGDQSQLTLDPVHESYYLQDTIVVKVPTLIAEAGRGVVVVIRDGRPTSVSEQVKLGGRDRRVAPPEIRDYGIGAQILAALGRKVAFASSVDLAELAGATEGFSGADLQALVYNAHLEVVHDAIAHPGDSSKPNGTSNTPTGNAEQPVKYTVLGAGGENQGGVLSRAEESAFQQRVRTVIRGVRPDVPARMQKGM